MPIDTTWELLVRNSALNKGLILLTIYYSRMLFYLVGDVPCISTLRCIKLMF